jgi:uncharacterized membrane protein SpoIIM required for sporulation
MKVSDLLESRLENWRQLERLCIKFEGRSRKVVPAWAVGQFSALYRAACADLDLADAYQLPPATVNYLHRLVARAHNQLYRSQTFNFRSWFKELFVEVPQRLFADNCLRLAAFVFFGIFILCAALAYNSPDFANQVVGKDALMNMGTMYSEPIGTQGTQSGFMVGFYIDHNAGIGLRCFAFGLLFGIGGLYETVFNAASLGAVFGHMARVPQAENFYNFVTAHAPFELTAIVLSAAAGMRLGFSLVQTNGLTRMASLREAANRAMPTMWAAILMFMMAAFIEAAISPSLAPYEIKAAVSVISSGMLMFYFVILGYPRGENA